MEKSVISIVPDIHYRLHKASGSMYYKKTTLRHPLDPILTIDFKVQRKTKDYSRAGRETV